jgi:hypothetical protein
MPFSNAHPSYIDGVGLALSTRDGVTTGLGELEAAGAGGLADAELDGGGVDGGAATGISTGANSGRRPHHTAPAARTVSTAQPVAYVKTLEDRTGLSNPNS